MKRKVKIFTIICYVNLFASLLFTILQYYQVLPINLLDISALYCLVFILTIAALLPYIANFYFGMRLSNLYKKPVIYSSTKSEKIFYYVEIFLTLPFTYLSFMMLKNVSSSYYYQTKFQFLDSFIEIVSYFFFLVAYLSSFCRVILAAGIKKEISLHNQQSIENLGHQPP